jgi:hypothetical protein
MKTMTVQVKVWRKGNEIYLAIPKENIVSTIDNKYGSARCHKHLYGKLKKMLEELGFWE